jgi:hypothetical protein
MRSLTRFAAFALLFALTSPVSAQQAVGFGGVNPSAIVNQPAIAPSSSSAGIPLFDHSVHLRDFMPSLKTFSNTSVFGQSAYPTPENMPGLNYLKTFGFSQPALPASQATTTTKTKRIPPVLLFQSHNKATQTSK